VAAVAQRADESDDPDVVLVVEDDFLEVINVQTVEVTPKVGIILDLLNFLFNFLNLLLRLFLLLQDLVDLDRVDDLELRRRWSALAESLCLHLERSGIADALDVEHSVIRHHASHATRVSLEFVNLSHPIDVHLADTLLLRLEIFGDASSSGAPLRSHGGLRSLTGRSSHLGGSWGSTSNASINHALEALLLLHA